MLKIKLITVGKIKEKYVAEGINEFEKRLRPFCRIETVELKDEGIAKESEKILRYIDNNAYVLDAKGKQFSSEEFAGFLKQNNELAFIIGGADGISEDVKKKAKLISLSKMTFLHEMCRLFLIEQIYRGMMINNNRGYYNK